MTAQEFTKVASSPDYTAQRDAVLEREIRRYSRVGQGHEAYPGAAASDIIRLAEVNFTNPAERADILKADLKPILDLAVERAGLYPENVEVLVQSSLAIRVIGTALNMAGYQNKNFALSTDPTTYYSQMKLPRDQQHPDENKFYDREFLGVALLNTDKGRGPYVSLGRISGFLADIYDRLEQARTSGVSILGSDKYGAHGLFFLTTTRQLCSPAVAPVTEPAIS